MFVGPTRVVSRWIAAVRLSTACSNVAAFASAVREQYPGCPAIEETAIARHACRKYSGRVGRSSSARDLDEKSVRLAVVAHVRHTETNYDELLGLGHDRSEAREHVMGQVERVLNSWRSV